MKKKENKYTKGEVVIVGNSIGIIKDIHEALLLVEVTTPDGKVAKWYMKEDADKYNKKPDIELGVLPSIYNKVKSFLKIKG